MTERLHESFALDGFVNRERGGELLFKDGSIGIVMEEAARDTECLDDSEIEEIGSRFESSLRAIDQRFRLYQYQQHLRTSEDSELFRVSTHMVLVMEPPKFKPGLAIRRSIEADMAAAVEELRTVAERFVAHLGSVIPTRIINAEETFTFLAGLLNYDTHRAESARFTSDNHLAYQLTMSDLETFRGPLVLGDTWFKVLTLKAETPERALPEHTVPDFIRNLRLCPVETIIVTEYKPMDPASTRSKLDAMAEHHHRQKYRTSWATAVANMVGSLISKKNDQQAEPRKDVVEEKAGAETEEAIANVAFDGIGTGEFALSIIVRASNKDYLKRAVAKVQADAGALNLGLFEEQGTAQMAWFATFPGGHDKQRHYMTITEPVYSDMALLYAPASGKSWDRHLNAPCLTTYETRQKTAFDYCMHVGQIPHAFMLGMTGYGKTFNCRHILREAKRKYDPTVFIFDMKEDYREQTAEFGGTFMKVGERGDYRINPFSLEPTERNLNFLHSLVCMLIEFFGYKMTSDDRDDVWKEIVGMCTRFPVGDDRRRLGSLIPAPHLRKELAPWIGKGRYNWLFDHAEDNLSFARWQAFSFEGLDQTILEPLLFYVLHRANEQIVNPANAKTFKIFLIDEAWLFFKNPTIREYIRAALKTWRSRNAAVLLATQSADDLEKSQILDTILESVGTKILLGNPGAKREWYTTKLGLNDTQFTHVTKMLKEKELMIVQDGVAKVVQLNVKPQQAAIKAAA